MTCFQIIFLIQPAEKSVRICIYMKMIFNKSQFLYLFKSYDVIYYVIYLKAFETLGCQRKKKVT